jgi:hypothetical protein
VTHIFLKPVAGRDTPNPAKGGALLPVEGDSVPLNAYWQRRINDGDVVKAEPVEPPAEAPKAPKAGKQGSASA